MRGKVVNKLDNVDIPALACQAAQLDMMPPA